MGFFSLITGIRGPSGFGSSSTAEEVTQGVDASNLTAIVTGGASGIGAETVRVLALRGARVVIGARNIEAGKAVKEQVATNIKNASVDVLHLDLSSMDSVRSFAKEFLAMNIPLNILINNAGVMFCPFQLSKDGLEMHFATNHIGHFLLTNMLLGKMKETTKEMGVEGRVVNLSSVAHFLTYDEGIQLHRLNDQSCYSEKKAYGQSKLANILHANHLSHQLKEEGVNITVNSVHPGFIMTNLMRHSVILMRFLKFLTPIIWKNVPQGASTTCYAALHPSLKGVTGKYFEDCNAVVPSNFATDKKLANQLWDLSMRMIS